MYRDVKISITVIWRMMGCCFGNTLKVSLSLNYCISNGFKFISGAAFHKRCLFQISVTVYLPYLMSIWSDFLRFYTILLNFLKSSYEARNCTSLCKRLKRPKSECILFLGAKYYCCICCLNGLENQAQAATVWYSYLLLTFAVVSFPFAAPWLHSLGKTVYNFISPGTFFFFMNICEAILKPPFSLPFKWSRCKYLSLQWRHCFSICSYKDMGCLPFFWSCP